MNLQQRIVFWIAFALILLAGLIPPWKVERITDSLTAPRYLGETCYFFIFSSPGLQIDPNDPTSRWRLLYTLDTRKLAVEEGIITLLAGVALLALKSPKIPDQPKTT
jgi:hypothetical protein